MEVKWSKEGSTTLGALNPGDTFIHKVASPVQIAPDLFIRTDWIDEGKLVCTLLRNGARCSWLPERLVKKVNAVVTVKEDY